MKKIICSDIERKTHEVEVDRLIFRPSVYGIFIEDNKILLSKQYDGYDFPGGGVDLHETMQEATVREVFEETGLKVEVGEVIAAETSFFYPKHSKKHEGEYWNCPLIYFVVKKTGGELSIENFDEEEKTYAAMAEWIDLSEIKNIKFINSIDSVAVIERAVKLLNS
jgi:8-oxo-dGTP diphosphatase